MKPILLIDGDVIRYRCAFAAQHNLYTVWTTEVDPPNVVAHFEKDPDGSAWDAYRAWAKQQDLKSGPGGVPLLPEGWQLETRVDVEPVENALHIIRVLMDSFKSSFSPKEMRVYGSCPTPENWRTKFYPEYKATRPDRKAEHDAAVREYLTEVWGAKTEPYMEADDAISLDAWNLLKNEIPYIIITNDKDMDQIPGVHLDWTKDEWDAKLVPEFVGELNLYKQVLTGDRTDNIPGLPGWGPKKAEAWFKDTTDAPEQVAMAAYREVYGDAWVEPFSLNKALCTLPKSMGHLRALVEEVKNARKDSQAAAEAGEGTSEGSGRGESRASDIPVPESGLEAGSES